ncbi:MAG: hypothetical protein HY735_03005 [Verrucomicrobia bacterium]|nr:hypothetical protein [Verrucomicrobiota bacterium]
MSKWDEMMRKVILIADDDPDDQEAIKRVLVKANVLNPVHCVSDGAEAISYLGGEGRYGDRTEYPHPAVLLLDLAMPSKTGL